MSKMRTVERPGVRIKRFALLRLSARKIIGLGLLLLIVGGMGVYFLQGSHAVSDYTFSDEFDSPSVNIKAWTVLNDNGNEAAGQAQCYRPANTTESSGLLRLLARSDSVCDGHKYTSGAVQWKSFTMRYGTIDVRAKFANSTGVQPMMRLLGVANNSNIIDIADTSAGNLKSCGSTVSNDNQYFHTYSVVWRPKSITWKVDGQTTCTQTQSIPDQPMALMLGVALNSIVNESTLPQTLQVDYVRVSE